MTPTAPPGLRAVVRACHAQRRWQVSVPERGDQDGLAQGTAGDIARAVDERINPSPSSPILPSSQYFENPPESVKTRLLHLILVWGRNLPDQPKIRDVRNMLQKQGAHSTGPQGAPGHPCAVLLTLKVAPQNSHTTRH
jgi:hypothetical protein